MQFQTASAIVLYERAIRADPAFIAPRRHYYAAINELFGPDEAQRRAALWPPAPPHIPNITDPAANMIIRRAQELERSADLRSAEFLLQTTSALLAHPRDRLAVLAALIELLDRTGQHARAQHYRSAIEAAIARDPRPAARYFHLLHVARAHRDSTDLLAAQLACRHRAYTLCGSALTNTVARHIDNGNPQSAIEHGKRALIALTRGGSPYHLGLLQMRLGRAYLKAGDYGQAELALQHAIYSATRAGSNYIRAESLHNLAHVHEARQDWPLARHTVDRFIAAAAGLHGAMKVVSLRDAGLIYWDSGHRAAARRYFAQMVRLIDAQNSDHFWAGEFYERAGDLHTARRYYQTALRGSADTARVTAGLVRIFLRLEEYDSAARIARMHDAASQTPEEVPLLPQVLAAQHSFRGGVAVAESWARRKEKERNLAGAANAWLQVGELRLLQGEAKAAAVAASRASSLATRGNHAQQTAHALLLLGNAQLAADPAAASMTLARAVAAARATGNTLLQARTHSALAVALGRNRAHKSSLQSADSALHYFDAVKDRFTDDFDRARFVAQRTQPYQTGLRILLQQNNAAQMVSWLQRHKARITSPRSVSARELQQALARDEALIDFALLDSSLIALVVTSGDMRLTQINTTTAELTQLVRRLRRMTEPHFGRIDWARAAFDQRTAHLLYQKTLLPLESVIGSRTKLLIVPDGVLHFVPFDALVVDPVHRRYVIDGHEVTYLPSSADVGFRRRASYQTFGIVHTDAPAAGRERDLVVAHTNAVQLVATESAVGRALQQYDVLHIAAHAEANAEQPLSSFLRLEAGAGGDGYLHIGEISALRASARLVFLSACETHGGRVYTGMGVMGLTQAFLKAGTHSVIATQWPVGATAASIADIFYRRLRAGDAPGAALRAAKLAARQDARTKDPLHWGAFMVVNSYHD